MKITIGSIITHDATGETFKVLCSCPGSKPREHTKRHVEANLAQYRYPTAEEVQSWHTAMSQGTAAPESSTRSPSIVPVSGNGRRVTFRDSNGLTFDAPNTADPGTLEYYRDQAALQAEPLRY